jgi:soluble lytic murein transglycosylase-like protein
MPRIEPVTPRRVAMALGCAFSLLPGGVGHAQSATAPAQTAGIDIAPHVRDASQRFGIPEAWIYTVIRIESAGRIRAVSPAGAMGLMQVMPGTWARQRARFALGNDPFDPRDNIMAGTSYLREMYDRYGAIGFIAAYNAGPGRYEEWRDKGRPLPLETRRYVASIAAILQTGSGIIAAAVQPALGAASFDRPAGERTLPAANDPGLGKPANPFATFSAPPHDLFAPVSTAENP